MLVKDMAAEYTLGYLEARGISSPQAVMAALQRVLESMEPLLYDEPRSGLTEEEQAVLREGGLRLERTSERDLVAEGAVRFAALVERSCKPEQVAKHLNVTPGRVHQMISNRDLYSFRLNGKRLVPGFQLDSDSKKLVPNIAQVNQLVPTTTHPLGVFNWFHQPNPDLFVDDEMETALSPLEWLVVGNDIELVKELARNL